MKINANIHLEIAGENALMLYFSDPEATSSCVTEKISSNVHQAAQLIRQNLAVEIIDLIPSYASILVMFNLLEVDHHHLRNKLKNLLKQCGHGNSKQGKLIELPVYYSLESGMDLARIAKQAKLDVEAVITLHQAQEYYVYAIGFAPGFAYLGDVSDKIATPRLVTPRMKVPKGAVAIADKQTAVYPSESPGGWNIIGLCPVDMFDVNAQPSMPIQVGDNVKFHAISKDEFITLGGKVEQIAGCS